MYIFLLVRALLTTWKITNVGGKKTRMTTTVDSSRFRFGLSFLALPAQLALLLIASALVGVVPTSAQEPATQPTINESNAPTEYYQPLPKGVTREKVAFLSDGTTVVGEVYKPQVPPNGQQKLPAIAILGPASGVKEQVPAVYARRLAALGYLTLAFDFRHWGESGGMPREEHDPDERIEDARSSVSYLHSRPDVDPQRIGLLGISFGGGYTIVAVATDTRVKAVATVSGIHGMAHLMAQQEGLKGYRDFVRRQDEARQTMFETDEVQYMPAYAPPGQPAAMQADDGRSYYLNPSRSYSPHWNNRYTVASLAKMLSFESYPYADLVTVPVLIVQPTKDQHWSPERTRRQVYEKLQGPKQFVEVEGNHADLYDGQEQARQAVAAIRRWFGTHL